jgi:hypothetical protein
MNEDTPRALSTVYMAIAGAGLGLTMQVMVVAMQNSVECRYLGVGTSTVVLVLFLPLRGRAATQEGAAEATPTSGQKWPAAAALTWSASPLVAGAPAGPLQDRDSVRTGHDSSYSRDGDAPASLRKAQAPHRVEKRGGAPV